MVSVLEAFKIGIVVLAYNRPAELQRTLQSLIKLEYNSPLDLSIHIDGPNSDLLVQKTAEVAKAFKWPKGQKSIRSFENNHGILGQWLEAWKDPEDCEYMLVVEDDVELSPHALRFLAAMIKKHYTDPMLYGIALQKAQWQLGICERKRWRRLDLVDEAYPRQFKYQALGTWGQLLFPGAWRNFLSQANIFIDGKEFEEGLVTEEWAKRGRRLISPVFMRWALTSGLYNLYSNFGTNALATSRQPAGVNSNGAIKSICSFPSRGIVEEMLILKAEEVRTMSPCFDPIDISLDDHLKLYKVAVTYSNDLDKERLKALQCCLAIFRIYPIAPCAVNYIIPQLVIQRAPKGGCFTKSPFELIQEQTGKNTRFVSEDGDLLMEYFADQSRVFEGKVVQLAWNSTARMLSRFGACSTYYCPFASGLYPDAPFKL